MKAYLVDAFTDKKYEGNRAGVILEADSLSTKEKQQIAAEINASESAFVSKSGVADFKVEFFTPTQEIDFCGHNTIATFYLLAALKKIQSTESGCNFTEETKAGVIPISVTRREGKIIVTMTQKMPQFKNVLIDRGAVAQALRINLGDLHEKFEIGLVSTANWSLMVGVKSEATLHSLSYDSNELSKIIEQAGAIGLQVFYMTLRRDFICAASVPP